MAEDTGIITELSQNECRVLHSLVKWPELSDQSIHSRIQMKKSTFSSIKTRLKEQNFYKRYFIPNFQKIGFELLMVMFGELNRFTTFEERMRIAGDVIKSFVEDFHIVSESNKAFNLAVCRNYTEYAKNIDKFFRVYSENKFLSKNGMSIHAFPFEISRIYSFLDYESLLAHLFGFSSQPYSERMMFESGPTELVKLTRAERKVLVGLIQYPDETDTLIAEEVGVSRNTVANAKRKFLKERICFPRVIPNIKKLGLNLLVFHYRKFNPKITLEQRRNASEMVRQLLAPHFYVSKNLDGFMVSAHKSFEDFNAAYDKLMRFYTKEEYIIEEPITYHISVPNMHEIKAVEFLPVTLKILGFEPDVPLKDQK